VRHRGKITATIANAQAVEAMRASGTSLKQIVWSHAPVARDPALARREDIPAQTAESAELARVLRKWGMRFVGATTVYAFMQSAGLVDDHLAGCHRSGVAGQALRKAARPRAPLPGPTKRPKGSSKAG
jgi:DNA-3-methyladenine glycosylase I